MGFLRLVSNGSAHINTKPMQISGAGGRTMRDDHAGPIVCRGGNAGVLDCVGRFESSRA